MYLGPNHVHPCSLCFKIVWEVEVPLLFLQAIVILHWSLALVLGSIEAAWRTAYMTLVVPWWVQLTDPWWAVLIRMIRIFFGIWICLLLFCRVRLELVIFWWVILEWVFLWLVFLLLIRLWGVFLMLVCLWLVFLWSILAPISPLRTSPALQGCKLKSRQISLSSPSIIWSHSTLNTFYSDKRQNQ